MTTYLTVQELLVINARVLDATIGTRGVRDSGLLASISEKPKAAFGGSEMYPSVHEKAAVYLESLATYHVFLDGNKRTALVATARFLYLNGYRFVASNKDAEEFMVAVAVSKRTHADITEWLRRNSERVS